MTVALCRPKRQERPILQPIAEVISSVQRTTLVDPARPSILATFRPWHGPALQIRATRSGTRSTSSSRKSKSPSSKWNETNSSRSRTRSTRSWRNRTSVKGQSSRWSSGTSNRRSNCSKNTNRSNSTCSSDSSQRTGSRPRGKIVLRRESPNRSLNRPSLNEPCGTRSRRSNGKVLAWIRLGCNTPGTPSFQRVPFFSAETPHSMVCDTVDACKIKPTLCQPRPESDDLGWALETQLRQRGAA